MNQPSLAIMLRLPVPMAERADKACAVMQERNPALKITRADVLRTALIEFCDRLDAEESATKKWR